MTTPISPINMDADLAEQIDGPRDPWAHVRDCGQVQQFRRDRIAASHPVMIRHRRRATVSGFVSNPIVIGASVAIIICCGIAAGLIIARFVGAS